ncbi:MAG: hypothetical protein KDA85_10920 [Planctomycetaceae bacterium]|nr:hypothetical protein [Planctomycetaceae bacterium]
MSEISVSEVLQLLQIEPSASAAIRGAIQSEDPKAFQAAFVKAIRTPQKRFLRRYRTKPLLALWSVNDVELSSRERELAASITAAATDARPERTHGANRRKTPAASRMNEILAAWLADQAGPIGVWESVAVAEILLRHADRLIPDALIRSLAALQQAWNQFEHPEAPDPALSGWDASIRYLMETGEARWCHGLLLGVLTGSRDQAQHGNAVLQKSLMECSEEDGTVTGSLISQLLPWISSLTRSAVWSRVFRQSQWDRDAQKRFKRVVERASLLLLADGQLFGTALEPLPEDSWEPFPVTRSATVLRVAARRAGLKTDAAERQLIRATDQDQVRLRRRSRVRTASGRLSGGHRGGGGSGGKRIAPSVQSDPSHVAILRSGFGSADDVLLAEWDSTEPFVGLAVGGWPVVEGVWDAELQLNGRAADLTNTWECTCWFHDEEVSFVELEAEQKEVVSRTRQLMLAPQDQFAVLVESFSAVDANAELQLRSTLELNAAVEQDAHCLTREVQLFRSGQTIRSFPLWLEDDRIQHALGGFRVNTDQQLILEAAGRGGVTTAVVFDWHPKRTLLPADWNRLTVAEARQNMSPREAAAFRLRVGSHQLMLYRSLRPPTVSRSVMGLHTNDETIYGRVLKTGIVSSLVSVDPNPNPESGSDG